MSKRGSALAWGCWLGCALFGFTACSSVPVQDSGRTGLIADIVHRREASVSSARVSAAPPRVLASSTPPGDPAPGNATNGAKAARLVSSQDEASESWKRPLPRVSLRWPLDVVEVTSPFGRRKSEFHEGIDLRAKVGTPVRAAQAGRVVYAGSQIRGYGKMVVVRHVQGLATVYAHNSRLLVHVGDKVAQGQELALSGMSGRASGPHLHFEVRSGIAAINPLEMLPRTASVDPTLIRSSGPIPPRRVISGVGSARAREEAGIAGRSRWVSSHPHRSRGRFRRRRLRRGRPSREGAEVASS